ncbi:hypothetical protein SERLA73DRAFT_129813, partial [Serpula lacrymans var. lacrymans S7.3]
MFRSLHCRDPSLNLLLNPHRRGRPSLLLLDPRRPRRLSKRKLKTTSRALYAVLPEKHAVNSLVL